MIPRRITLPLLITALLCASCSNSLFRVKPATELPALPNTSRTATAGNVTMRVAPFLTDEQVQELFEANLPLIGILPVRVELVFQNDIPIKIEKAKVRLQDAQGRQWKWLTPKQAASSIRKASGIKLYNPNAQKQFEQDLGTYGVDLKTPLAGAKSRRSGFFFFQSPDKLAVPTGQQFVLSVEKLPQPLSITIQ